MFKFPPAVASTYTDLVLKEPKPKTSIRKISLPKTVAEMLVKRHEDIENLKELFGEEYMDLNFLRTYPNMRNPAKRYFLTDRFTMCSV